MPFNYNRGAIIGIITTGSTESTVEDIKTWTIASIYEDGTFEYKSLFYIKQIGAI